MLPKDELVTVTVTQVELDHLRLQDRRFRWLLQFWGLATGQKSAVACDFVDGCLGRDETPVQAAQLAGIPIPGKKKSPGQHARGTR
jgi:hypothetical protein